MPPKPSQNPSKSPFQSRARRTSPAPATPAKAKAGFGWRWLGALSEEDGPLLVALLITAGAGLSTGVVIGFVIFGL